MCSIVNFLVYSYYTSCILDESIQPVFVFIWALWMVTWFNFIVFSSPQCHFGAVANKNLFGEACSSISPLEQLEQLFHHCHGVLTKFALSVAVKLSLVTSQ